MFKELDLAELRRVPGFAFCLRYPLHHKDFHEVRAGDQLVGRYAAKPLYGPLTSEGKVDRSEGYDGRVAVVFLPARSRSVRSARVLLTRMPRKRATGPDGRRNWPAIRAAAERAVRWAGRAHTTIGHGAAHNRAGGSTASPGRN
jgi:hypothetical protein